jgi:predicted Zn-dependent protease
MNFGLTFPAGWETINQPEYVAAVAKEQDALLILQIQSKGNDPVYAARSFLYEAKLGNQPVHKLTIGGYPAGQTMLYHKGQETIIYWIAFQEQIYRLTGVSKNSKAGQVQSIKKTASTFHQLTSKERTKIRQLRLRIVTAREDERLKAILKRFGSTWDEVTCAVANNLQTEVSLKKGQLIKVAIPEALK